MKIDEKVSLKSHYIVLPSSYSINHLRSYRKLQPEREGNVRRLVPSKSKIDSTIDYVPLISERRQAKNHENQLKNWLQFDQDYRSMEGKAKDNIVDDEVSNSSEDDEINVNEARHSEAIEKRKKLEFEAKSNIFNSKKWIEFADFQYEFVKNEGSFKLSNLHSVVADLQCKIYDKAIELQAGNVDIDLIIRKLKIGSKFALFDEIEEWKKYLNLYSNNFNLHLNYIDYIQNIGSITKKFELNDELNSFEIVCDSYKQSFEVLLDVMFLESVNINSRIVNETNLMKLFLKFVNYLNQSGYHERAIALIQAKVELMFGRPNEFEETPKFDNNNSQEFKKWNIEVVDALQEWWELNENPKIGENCYKGWKNTLNEKPPIRTVYENDTNPNNYTLNDWYLNETLIDNNISNRRFVSAEYNASDDPFRNVMFDYDLKPYLFVPITKNSVNLLLNGLLNLLGFSLTLDDDTTNNENSNYVDLNINFTNLFNNHNNLISIRNQPFNEEYLISILPSLKFDNYNSTIDIDYFRTIVRQLRMVVGLKEASKLELIIENDYNNERIEDIATEIFNQFKFDDELYDIYARIENRKGKIESGRRIYETALEVCGELKQRIRLCFSWSYMEFLNGNNKYSLNILCYGLNNNIENRKSPNFLKRDMLNNCHQIVELEVSSMNILKARKAWSDLNISSYHVVASKSLLEYLVTKSPKSSIEIYQSSLLALDYPSLPHELLLLSFMNFIQIIQLNLNGINHLSIKDIRRFYNDALKLYPHNSYFSYVYVF